jgi:hypothetical protein
MAPVNDKEKNIFKNLQIFITAFRATQEKIQNDYHGRFFGTVIVSQSKTTDGINFFF